MAPQTQCWIFLWEYNDCLSQHTASPYQCHIVHFTILESLPSLSDCSHISHTFLQLVTVSTLCVINYHMMGANVLEIFQGAVSLCIVQRKLDLVYPNNSTGDTAWCT